MKVKTKFKKKQLDSYTAQLPYKIGCKVGFFEKKSRRYEVKEDSFSASIFGFKTRAKSAIPADITNVQVAYRTIKWYGVPKRDFFALFSSTNFWKKENFSFLKGFYKKNKNEINEVQTRLGNLGTAVLQRAIQKYNGVPLHPLTVKQKKGSKQLIDSGQLISAISFKKEDIK